jgi:alkylation response protein AidB-like acyl-CoA dehydrogenase
MDVLLNDEEELLKHSVREFLERECPPAFVREMEADDLGYPPALWATAARLGWLGLALPEQYGGDGAPLTHLAIVMEEAGRAAAPLPLLSSVVTALIIAAVGSEEQKNGVLPPFVRGESLLTFAIGEEDPRIAPEAIECAADADGDGFRIHGRKLFVDNFHAASHALVACRTAAASATGTGVSLFLVDVRAPGISHQPLPTMAGDRQSLVTFDGVHVRASALVGQLHAGWPVVERLLDVANGLLCAQIVGATRKTVEMAIDYAKDRVAFGRPIGAFQAIAHICADIVTWVDAAQLLTYEAVWRLSQGLPASTEVAMAKAFCNTRCQMCLHQANQIHGGLSQITDFDLQLWYRRASAWTMRLGTTFDEHRKVADAILG